jgi:hypothetical protein
LVSSSVITKSSGTLARYVGSSDHGRKFDTYGHLFSDADADQRAAEGVEARLLGV